MNATREMPAYKSHKTVHALQITSIVQAPASHVHPGGSWFLHFFEDGYAPIEVSHDWYAKHGPHQGGYFVVYKDGYRSFSPRESFETGHTLIDAHAPVSEEDIAKVADKGPRVTPAAIEAEIAGEYYFTAAQATQGCPQFPSLGLLTFCVLALKNGFTVTGESACASPENFNADTGQRIARENAINKVWPLLGFRLRDRLHECEVSSYDPKTDAMDGGRLG